jgi:hypothetical protein
MSEVRLVVREAERDWSGTIHGSCADRAIAALSADPVTLEELEVAVGRFEKPRLNGRFFLNLRQSSRNEPYDAGLVVIDLVARLVVVDSTYSDPEREGVVEYHNGECSTQKALRYHLADDWLFSRDGDHWQHVADRRRKERAAQPVRDNRQVFYGRPLAEFIARECFATFARRDEIAAAVRQERAAREQQRQAEEAQANLKPVSESESETEDVPWPAAEDFESRTTDDAAADFSRREPTDIDLYYDSLKNIHAAWLLTPRDDLGGLCPREVAQERRKHLTRDLEDRCLQWSTLHECPPGLPESSHAYQYAGFGIHELVKYYDLVRELLWSCWSELTRLADAPGGQERLSSFMVGDFLTTEVPRLEAVREAWFDEPDPECHGRTPRSIIERERARLPEGMSGHDAMVDPDCPCCQMLADLPGPSFWHLDGCNMDDDFAFDIYCRTREDWDAERRSWEEHNRKFNAEQAERERLGVTDSARREEGPNAAWSRSFAIGETADVPLGIRVFGIGCRLAELIVGLRGSIDREDTPAESQRHIDQLNHDFGNLREILQSADSSLAGALIDPVIQRFAESLATVASARPDVASQCESLTEELQQLLNPPEPEEPWDSDGDGLPF